MVLTRLVMILSLIFSAFPTQAEQTGLYVSQNLFGVSLRFNTGPSSVQDKTLISSETGLGYILGGWAYLGGVFNYTMVNEKTTDSGSNAVTHQETSIVDRVNALLAKAIPEATSSRQVVAGKR